MTDPKFALAISEITNALQTAAPLAIRLRELGGEPTEDDLRTLEAAIDRAVLAVRQLRPAGRGGA